MKWKKKHTKKIKEEMLKEMSQIRKNQFKSQYNKEEDDCLYIFDIGI